MRSPIAEAFGRTVEEQPNREALWSRGESLRLTFSDLAARVERRADVLSSEPDEATALATGNCAAFLELFLALRRLDRPVLAVDGALPIPEKTELCRRLGVGSLLHRDEAGGAFDDVRLLQLDDVERTPPPAGTALVKLTSGSTGEPEGICLGGEALMTGIHQIGRGMGLSPDDRVLVTIPLSHSYGFDNGVLSLAVLGTPLVLEPRFFPGPLIRALDESEATFFPVVPPLVRSLSEQAWPSALALRTVICAGGRLAPEVAETFLARSGRPVHQFYGSTETGGIAFEREPLAPEATGTVGMPLPGVDVRLDDDGRVRVRSDANYGGVHGRDEELSDPREVRLGDYGEWTPSGRLRLTGRTIDFVNVGGRKISLAAIEQALRGLDGLEDVAVVGVNDELRGERVVAFVVGEDDALDLGELPPTLTPREVRRVPSLPYTARGKLDRRRLTELAGERT